MITNGLLISEVPVIVIDKLEAVELNNCQKQPESVPVSSGIVNELNPVLVNLQIPPEFVDVKVKDVPVVLTVIALYSVGLTNLILFVADNWKL